jgi:hypothetical protein
MNICVSAVQHLRRVRRGSQSHLLRASDGAHYVTKFMNNPQRVSRWQEPVFRAAAAGSLPLSMREGWSKPAFATIFPTMSLRTSSTSRISCACWFLTNGRVIATDAKLFSSTKHHEAADAQRYS